MNAAIEAVKVPTYEIRQATEADLIAMTEPGGLGHSFFLESEFKNFTTYDPMKLRETLFRTTQTGEMIVISALCLGELAGGILFTVSSHYTVEPMAQLFLFYVHRRRRFSPLGKMLLEGAEMAAKQRGAVVFYAGATANMGNKIDERMMNMLDKMGYIRLGGVSRKLLEQDDE